VNVNIGAKVWGAEFEGLWEPLENLRFNANIGYLDSKLDSTTSLDLMNLTQGNPALVTVKNGTSFSNCIAAASQVAQLQALINAGVLPAIAFTGVPGRSDLGICQGAFAAGSPLSALARVDPINGVPAQLAGNELPNAPHWTVSLGAQYEFDLGGGWAATPRVDFYYQAKSFARIFNAINDKLDSYTNTNVSLIFANAKDGWRVQAYVKNLTKETVVTDHYQTDDTSGLFTNIFLTEPRTYGVAVTKEF
jgi:outer membrane receptor protein involved in Fe transport